MPAVKSITYLFDRNDCLDGIPVIGLTYRIVCPIYESPIPRVSGVYVE